MLNIILIAVAVIIALFVVIVATRPSDFRVTRTGRISAPADVVFANVNTLRNWEGWSPWAKVDPNAKSTFSGPESGPGSSMHWSGNKKVGEGRMTIIDSKPNEVIHIKLEFLRPMKVTNMAEFLLNAGGNQTTVTWTMTGNYNIVTKAMSVFMDCDKMCGPMFEKGLADLKGLAEAEAHK